MIHSPKFTVVLDACVLYPAPVRDILLSLASEGLFKPKWTYEIQDEWMRNLLKNRSDLSVFTLEATVQAMNSAFPDSNVENNKQLIPSLQLPDQNDRHVLACAIRCNADLITTFNLKDFPSSVLGQYDIEIQSPDEFILNLIELNEKLACKALSKLLKRLNNPPKTKKEIIEIFRKCQLIKSAKRLSTCN
jgi:predicted nucleic acid-binding protein